MKRTLSVIGSFLLDYTGLHELTILIRESVYKKVMSGTYKIKPGQITLTILDEKENPVPPFAKNYIY